MNWRFKLGTKYKLGVIDLEGKRGRRGKCFAREALRFLGLQDVFSLSKSISLAKVSCKYSQREKKCKAQEINKRKVYKKTSIAFHSYLFHFAS